MNIIGMKYIRPVPAYRLGFTYHRRGHWQTLYCVPAAPDDPPVYCGAGILEVWTPFTAQPGQIVDPRKLIDYPRSMI